MLIKKVTEGYVIQVFDTTKSKFIAQEFIASGEVTYEKLNSTRLQVHETIPFSDNYLSFDMVQPE